MFLRFRAFPVGQEAPGEHGAGGGVRGVKDVAVERRELDGGVQGGRGGAADQQRRREAAGGHFAAQLLHLEERRGDEPADADEVGADLRRLVEKGLQRDHHAQVRDLESVAAQHDAGDVLADVVDVALDRGDQETGFARTGGFLAHIGLEDFDGVAHHLGGLDDLGEEHLACGEALPDPGHAVHQRPFDDIDRAAFLLQARQQVLLQGGRTAQDECADEAFAR